MDVSRLCPLLHLQEDWGEGFPSATRLNQTPYVTSLRTLSKATWDIVHSEAGVSMKTLHGYFLTTCFKKSTSNYEVN